MKLFIDDEPLDSILYGKQSDGPTNANLYLLSIKYVQTIDKAVRGNDIQGAIQKASDLLTSGLMLSKQVCYDLAYFMYSIVPFYPNPILQVDLSPLCPLVNDMWSFVSRLSDKKLIKEAGRPLGRFYEHTCQYEKAREVFSRLIELYQGNNNPVQEAIAINNFAFEYLLEGRFREAMPLFVEAADIFRKNYQKSEYANARANYLTCKIESGEFSKIGKMGKELNEHAKILKNSAEWQMRKPFILLARIEEHCGNIKSAIRFTEKVIGNYGSYKTRYPEMDKRYLEHLKELVIKNRPDAG